MMMMDLHMMDLSLPVFFLFDTHWKHKAETQSAEIGGVQCTTVSTVVPRTSPFPRHVSAGPGVIINTQKIL